MQIPTLGPSELFWRLKQGICLSTRWTGVQDFTAVPGLGRAGDPHAGEGPAPSTGSTAVWAGEPAWFSAPAPQCSAWRIDLACCGSQRQPICQAVRHGGRGASTRLTPPTPALAGRAARRSSREQAAMLAFITLQQGRSFTSPCRLLQRLQCSPEDFFLILRLLEVTGGTVLPNGGLARQVSWPAIPGEGSPRAAQN